MVAHRSKGAAETWNQTEWFVGESIEAGILPVEYHKQLPSLEKFIDQCAQLAVARNIFKKHGLETRTILVPKNLKMQSWESLFATQFSDGSQIHSGDITKNMTGDRETLLSGPSWGVALVSDGYTPIFNGSETTRLIKGSQESLLIDELKDRYVDDDSCHEKVIKELSPSLETYLAYQLDNILWDGELVDVAKDWATNHKTIGRASLLAEDMVVQNINEEMVVKSLCAGSNSLHASHRIWVGTKDIGSLTPEIGFRPTVTLKN